MYISTVLKKKKKTCLIRKYTHPDITLSMLKYHQFLLKSLNKLKLFKKYGAIHKLRVQIKKKTNFDTPSHSLITKNRKLLKTPRSVKNFLTFWNHFWIFLNDALIRVKIQNEDKKHTKGVL